jgi:MFS superfamily sulfate permease-like transporter
MTKERHPIPATGWQGIALYWRNDLIAAFSVALVALPISLGIATASGMPPISGLMASMIGGLVTTFFRGGHIAINGPAAGLIAVVLGAITSMEDGSGRGINYMLAAVVVSGGIQMLMGLLRMGKLASIFPSAVISGMLAAIGIIILSQQLHVAMGTETQADHTMGVLIDAVRQLPELNPFIAIIALISLLILAFHPRMKHPFFRYLPAPIWVLCFALPFVYGFNFFEPHTTQLLGKQYAIGPELLVNIPDKLLDAFWMPDFSQMHTPAFWISVLSITLIGSLEILVIARAVDKLDPYQRVTDTNKDLIGNGLATLVCGCIGGLPIIPVIARSSVNIQNNAKTRWSNFYYGLFLLLFVLLLGPLIRQVPLTALAAILIYTGYTLASPRVFRLTYERGTEQLFILSATIVITLFKGLLWGVFGGVFIALLLQIILSRIPIGRFFRLVFRSAPKIDSTSAGQYRLSIPDIANFLSLMKIEKALQKIPSQASVIIDLTEAQLVDLTVRERLKDFIRRYEEQGGKAELLPSMTSP